MNYKNLKYKSYEGTVVLRSDWKFEGEVIGLTKNRKYFGKDFNELEAQFKNKVDYFHEQCAMLGVEPEPLRKRQSPKLPYLVLFFSAIFIMCFLWWFYTSEFPLNGATSKTDVNVEWFDKSGSFFNNFSAPILSFFSFMGLLFTIYQQNRSHQLSLKELALTREELELTRKEFAKTTIANEKQANALDQQVKEAKSAAEEQRDLATEQRLATQIQQFESSFYALFSEHNKVLGELVAENRTLKINNFGDMRFEDALDKVRGDAQLSTYFRMLYQLLKFVATSNVENNSRDFSKEYLGSPVPEGEKRYASLIRSMLPNDVLGWLSVNCIEGVDSEHLYNKYFLLIERYAFLEHFNFKDKLLFKYTQPVSGRVKECPSVIAIVLQKYTHHAFGSNENLIALDGEIKRCLKDSNSNTLDTFFKLGRGRDGSTYEVMMRRYITEGSPLISMYGD
ncbi:putative phage abortive infection protein [Vibrio alginolyticus]|uniref:putative phage abortive infection protein n=1 Tax=Vibrio alginolyticus TaxID=663 RepID=UPI002FF06BB4